MLFGAASFLGFIPYIIVFMIKSFQVLMQHKYCLHWNKCTYYDCIYHHPIYSFQVGDGVTPARIAHIVFAMLCPVYIPFGVTSQME